MIIVRALYLVFINLSILNASSAQDTIYWKSNSKLKWTDFQAIPDSISSHRAISSLSISYTLTFNDTTFSFRVYARFNKRKSWTKSTGEGLLSHEQGHFDITELYARKLRQEFKNYKINRTTIAKDLKEIYNRIIIDRDKMDSLYDIETSFSRNKSKQIYWSKKILTNLDKFELYKE